MFLRANVAEEIEHAKRKVAHEKAGEAFKRSVATFFEKREENLKELEGVTGLFPYDEVFETNEDPEYENEPYGPVSNLKDAGCGVFCTAFLRRLYIPLDEFDTIEWAREIVSKGYRSWHFTGKDYSHATFTADKVFAKIVANRFNMPELEGKTREELEKVLGKIEGIGTSYFLIDYVISALTGATPFEDTRVRDVVQLVNNLKSGIPVVVRVENSVYHRDSSRTGGHYITLIGMCDGHFIVADSSVGILLYPIEEILKAATAGGACVVWNCFDVPQYCIKK